MTESIDVDLDPPFSLVRMFWGNITARPLRCALSVIAIAIQVILVLMIVGLTSGVISEWGKRVEGVGADIMVQPPNASIFIAFSSAVMPENLRDQIEALPGVDEVAPVVILTEPKNLIMIYGIDYKRFNALSRGFLYRAGRPFQGPNEVLADDIIAQQKHLKVGDHVTLLNRDFTVSGIVAHGKGARYFIPIKTAQEAAGVESRVSMFYVRSKGNTEATRAEILKLTPQNRVRSMSEYVSLMSSSNLPELKPFVRCGAPAERGMRPRRRLRPQWIRGHHASRGPPQVARPDRPMDRPHPATAAAAVALGVAGGGLRRALRRG